MYTGRPGGKKKKEKRREEKRKLWGERNWLGERRGGVTCKVKLRVPAFWASLPFNLCLLFGTYCGVGGVLSFGGGVKSDGSGRGEAGQAGGIPTRGILQQENSELSLMHNLSSWNVISR